MSAPSASPRPPASEPFSRLTIRSPAARCRARSAASNGFRQRACTATPPTRAATWQALPYQSPVAQTAQVGDGGADGSGLCAGTAPRG